MNGYKNPSLFKDKRKIKIIPAQIIGIRIFL
jgi:hypothetical protein